MKNTLLILTLLAHLLSFGTARTSTASVGVWNPSGTPANGDVLTVTHDWSAGYAVSGALANAFTGSITIENGGYYKITNALANFAGTITVESGGNYEIDGDMTNWTGAVDIQTGGVFTSNYNFNAGDDAAGASLTVNGTLVLTAGTPHGVLTLDLVVGGSGSISARSIVLNGNGSTGATTLPVELISFKGRRSAEITTLNWVTASEVNNDYFEIQASEDGIKFEILGSVIGNGNTSEVSDYGFIDSDGSNIYYRLKQYDYEGTYEYSHVISMAAISNNFRIIQKQTSNEYYILTEEREVYEVKVFDWNGKLVSMKELQGEKGGRYNYILPNTGLYLITVSNGNSIVSKKSIVR